MWPKYLADTQWNSAKKIKSACRPANLELTLTGLLKRSWELKKQHFIDNPSYMAFRASDSCMELQEVLRSIPERSPHITIHQAAHRAKLWLRLFTENREGNGHVLLAT